MVCGMPHATAVLAREFARRAIAHRSARARRPDGTGTDERDGGSGVTCGVPVTLWGCVPCLEYMLGQCLSA